MFKPTDSAKAMIEGLEKVAFYFKIRTGNLSSGSLSDGWEIYEYEPTGSVLQVEIIFTAVSSTNGRLPIHYKTSDVTSANVNAARRIGLFDIRVSGSAGSITAHDVQLLSEIMQGIQLDCYFHYRQQALT